MIVAMFALVLLTITVGMISVRTRMVAVKHGALSKEYFKLMQSESVPEQVVKSTRCFNNLFEVPVLFYVVCTLYVFLAINSTLALVVAWLFVLLRIAQAYIHLSYNNVYHRMIAYGGALICVVILWITLLMQVLTTA